MIIKECIGFILRHSPNRKLTDLLLWPVSKRLLKNYEETVSLTKGLTMHVYGDMPDMVNKTLLYSEGLDFAWEPATARLVHSLQAKRAVVAGSHIGYYPLIITHANAEAQVFAFEPNPQNFQRLVVNKNNRIHTFDVALGDTNENKNMHFDAGQSSLVDTQRKQNEHGEVKVVTLDTFLKEPIDLMVLDAEGYEFNILKGSKQTISEHHPDIVFEVNPSTGTSYATIKEFLAPFGYIFYLINDNYHHSLKMKNSDFEKNNIELFKDQKIENFVNIYATTKK